MAGVQGTPGQMRRPLRSWSGWQTSSPRRQQPGWRRRSGKLFLALWALLQVLPSSQGAGKAVSGRCFCQVHFGAGGLSHYAQHSLTHKLWHKIWRVVTRSGSISCVSGAAFNRYDGETAPRTLGSLTLAMRHSSCSHLRSGLCEPIVLGILLRCSSDSMRYLAGDIFWLVIWAACSQDQLQDVKVSTMLWTAWDTRGPRRAYDRYDIV